MNLRARSALLLLGVLCIIEATVRVSARATPLANNEHPRLGMTAADLSAIGARLSTGGEWHSQYQAFVNAMTASEVWNTTSTALHHKPVYCMSIGFGYAVFPYVTGISYPGHADTQAEWGAKGVQFLIDTTNGTVNTWDTRRYRSIEAIPHFFAFDWLYSALSPSQRADIVSAWRSDTLANNETMNAIEAVYPSYTTGAWNWKDSRIIGEYGAWILMGLAAKGFGGSSSDEAWLQTGIDRYSWAFRNSASGAYAITNMESARAGNDGGFVQNESYGFSYVMARAGAPELAYRTAQGISKQAHYGGADASWIRRWPSYMQYYLQPYQASGRYLMQSPGQTIDVTSDGAAAIDWAMGLTRGELQGVDQSESDLAAWLLANKMPDDVLPQFWPFTRFLHQNNAARSASAVGLPLDRAFAAGRYMWRTGWSNNADALIQVYADRFMAGAHDVANGSFAVEYNGPALVYGHVYNHEFDGMGLDAHNTVGVVPKTNSTNGTLETGKPDVDDYGFKRNNPSTLGAMSLAAGSTADYLSPALYRTTGADGIGYLSLDLSRAYQGDAVNDQSGSSPKVASILRHMVYVPPATPGSDSLRLFLFDSVVMKSTGTEVRQTFNLSGAPTVNGSAGAGPVRNGSSGAKTTYSGATVVSYGQTLQGSNRTFISPLAPTDSSIVVVNYRRDVNGSKVEDAFGRLHDATNLGGNANQARSGRYRVEIIPAASQTVNNLCTAIEVVPSAGGAQRPTEAVGGTNFIGGRIGDAIAVHATSSAAGTFVLQSAGTYRLFVGGLGRQVSRTFTTGGNISSLTTSNGSCSGGCAATAEGTLSFTVVVAAGGTGAANTISVSGGTGGAPNLVPAAPTNVRIIR